MRMGIKLEPDTDLAAEIYAKALKKKEQSVAKVNVLGPARLLQRPLQRGPDVEIGG